MSLPTAIFASTKTFSPNLDRLRSALAHADAVVIGAGAGLSTAAGFSYGGERFQRYFGDFAKKYGIRDMYSGGFYPFPTMEEYWGWWARHIYVNRYLPTDSTVYPDLLELVKDKDYFVITTNVDHQFQTAGFDKSRLFYMQGDYGLWQCSRACTNETFDNEDAVIAMLLSTGFLAEDEAGEYVITSPENWRTSIDSALIPTCPHCGEPLTMNLRVDDTFVEDEGWHAAKARHDEFLQAHTTGKVLYLELGVGANTPVWIKYPFWRMTMANPQATYACLNYGEAYAPGEIAEQSIVIDGDFAEVLPLLRTS